MGKSIGRALKYFWKERECICKRTGNVICMILNGFIVVSVRFKTILHLTFVWEVMFGACLRHSECLHGNAVFHLVRNFIDIHFSTSMLVSV
jgi:hypothetical protein